MNTRKHPLAIAMLLLVTLIWGSGFIATEYAIESGLPTAWILLIRFLVGAAMIGIGFFPRIKASPRPTIRRGLGAGVILFAAFFAQTAGQRQTAVSNAAFLTATYVVMIPFLLWLFTKKRPPVRVFLLCLMTMAGVMLLTISGDLRPTFGGGDALVLLCALLFALHITCLGLFCAGDDPVQTAFWQLFAAALCGGAMLIISPTPLTGAQLRVGILPTLYLGVFSTGVCYFLQTWAQTKLSASEAGIILSAEGMFGTGFSLLLGLEPFRWPMALGGVLITLSVCLAEARPAEDPPA